MTKSEINLINSHDEDNRNLLEAAVTEEITSVFPLISRDGLVFVDSRLIAKSLGIEHDNFYQMICKHQREIVSNFGGLLFETGVPIKPSGNPPKFILLTEDQALFVGTLSRNSEKVIEFKAKLVKTFQSYRNQSALSPEAIVQFRNEISSTILHELKTTIVPDIVQEYHDIYVNGPIKKNDARLISACVLEVPDETKLLTEHEASTALNMSVQTLRKLQVLKIGPKVTPVGLDVRYKDSDISDYVLDPNGNSAKGSLLKQIIRQLSRCKNIKSKGGSCVRLNPGDYRRLKLLQEYFEIIDGEKISQVDVFTKAFDALCNTTVFSAK